MNYQSLGKYLTLVVLSLCWSSQSVAQDANQVCEEIDFNQFSHGDAIQTLSLFGGALTLNVTALRNSPAGAVNVTAYDTELWNGIAPPNSTHNDTQLMIDCNDAANGGLGNCDGIMALIPDVDFAVNGDDTQGGTITFTSTGTEFEILQYKAVDSDNFNRRIILNVGGVNVGEATVFGNGSVITVLTDDHSTTQAEFEFLGSGGIDDIQVCRVVEGAALGDRVWEDLNANGIQDCSDTGGDGVIGNTGDTGPECDAGIADVPVNLLAGDCITPLGQMVMTDMNGFYLFPDLDPGDYCVEFDINALPADFCTTDGFDLGAPQFTAQNAGNDDAIDSDADPVDGLTDPVSLSTGETDLTVDAGIYCPAKIGDRVWNDDNEDGLQDNGEAGVPGVTVKLFECTDGLVIVDNNKLVRTTTTDDAVDDMNYMFGAEPDFALEPGEYFVQYMKPDGTQFTLPKVGSDDSIDSDCLPPNGTSACVTVGSRGINLNRDCGLIPPPPPQCNLDLDKKCRIETPPVSGDLECEAKIAATVLEYTGPGTPSVITVTGKDKDAQVVSNFDAASGILTVDARPGDLGSKMTITTDGVVEVIHTSCSAPYVAGQPAPLDSPKGDPSANWLVVSFVDKNGGSASVPGDVIGMFTDSCTFTPGLMPSCDTLKANDEKLISLTFKYTGGGCPGDNDQGDKSSCSGSIDPNEGVTVQAGEKEDNLNYPVQPMFVAPDGEFTVDPAKFNSNSVLVAGNTGGTEINEFHTSCSQPLAVGDVFGSFTLAAINGQHGSTEVTYQYTVTNNGDPLTGINLTDNVLGAIAGPFNLASGDSSIFTRSANITGTTVNVATASTSLGGALCSASDSTTVTVIEPPVVGGECDGKVTDLVLKNLGAGAQVRVDQKKDGTVFNDFVPAGGEFSFSGTDKKDTLGTEISIFVNDNLNTKIHTSCSQPIGPGLVSGSFEVISGNSRNGGPLPPL